MRERKSHYDDVVLIPNERSLLPYYVLESECTARGTLSLEEERVGGVFNCAPTTSAALLIRLDVIRRAA